MTISCPQSRFDSEGNGFRNWFGLWPSGNRTGGRWKNSCGDQWKAYFHKTSSDFDSLCVAGHLWQDFTALHLLTSRILSKAENSQVLSFSRDTFQPRFLLVQDVSGPNKTFSFKIEARYSDFSLDKSKSLIKLFNSLWLNWLPEELWTATERWLQILVKIHILGALFSYPWSYRCSKGNGRMTADVEPGGTNISQVWSSTTRHMHRNTKSLFIVMTINDNIIFIH